MGTNQQAGDAAVVAGPVAPQWPMPVETFFNGPWLEPSDVLLMRERSSTFANLVRLFTGSFFSKAALVFLVPHREKDFDTPFVIEAAFEGVDLTDLKSFVLSREKRFVIAVKRVECEWFDLEHRHLVRGFMLNYIKADYDYGKLFDNLWASLKGAQFFLLRLVLGPHWALRQITKRRPAERLNKFIGPGLVQWGYWEATKFLVDHKLAPAERLDDVVFRERLFDERAKGKITGFDEDDLLGVTAEDIAKSSRLSWKYAIVNGRVYEVASEGEFYDLLRRLRRLRLAGRASDEAQS
ncbi:MAG: hypothetical protein ACOYLQ_02945 [Hyphomicrobiaceae bacterium]